MKNSFKSALLWASFLISPFTGQTQYVLSGNATDQGGGCYQLTVEAQSQAGAVWFQNKITLNEDVVITGTLNLGSIDDGGADGMAFVLQPICSGLGSLGGGLGYQGISPSIAVEFDTWQNGDFGDPYEDHIALMQNGSIWHGDNLQGPFILDNLEDGASHPFIIEWNAVDNNLKVTLDGVERINYTGDIVTDIFGGNDNVFWGFTGATGAAINYQTVCISSVSFTEEGSFTVTNPSCTDANDGAIDLDPAGGIEPITFAWSNGETTEDISGLSAGTYGVTVTDGNLCQTVYSISIENEGEDSDCDGVNDSCDVCPGGDDTVDNNNDGFPDCDVFPGESFLDPAWACGRDGGKISLCHIPPDNPAARHTICISAAAVQAHLNHGCYVGPCENASCGSEAFAINLPEFNAIAAGVWEFEVYPNPASDDLNIVLIHLEEDAVMQLIDPVGRVVVSQNIKAGEQEINVRLDNKQIALGLYTVLVQSASETLTKRIVINQ